jgi:hypothetical protein
MTETARPSRSTALFPLLYKGLQSEDISAARQVNMARLSFIVLAPLLSTIVAATDLAACGDAMYDPSKVSWIVLSLKGSLIL